MDRAQTVREADELRSDGFETRSLREPDGQTSSIQQQFDMRAHTSTARSGTDSMTRASRSWTLTTFCQDGASALPPCLILI